MRSGNTDVHFSTFANGRTTYLCVEYSPAEAKTAFRMIFAASDTLLWCRPLDARRTNDAPDGRAVFRSAGRTSRKSKSRRWTDTGATAAGAAGTSGRPGTCEGVPRGSPGTRRVSRNRPRERLAPLARRRASRVSNEGDDAPPRASARTGVASPLNRKYIRTPPPEAKLDETVSAEISAASACSCQVLFERRGRRAKSSARPAGDAPKTDSAAKQPTMPPHWNATPWWRLNSASSMLNWPASCARRNRRVFAKRLTRRRCDAARAGISKAKTLWYLSTYPPGRADEKEHAERDRDASPLEEGQAPRLPRRRRHGRGVPRGCRCLSRRGGGGVWEMGGLRLPLHARTCAAALDAPAVPQMRSPGRCVRSRPCPRNLLESSRLIVLVRIYALAWPPAALIGLRLAGISQAFLVRIIHAITRCCSDKYGDLLAAVVAVTRGPRPAGKFAELDPQSRARPTQGRQRVSPPGGPHS
mmetsp:Transcript_11639/g.35866  ORF Transcript_11639/g.35866 Transcript_11639/m.35866 type:complete len:471 (-) Transcript_11639:10-1422(-)